MYFSIIVPVYNVEDYLEDCVDSILRQTYKKFELLLIDDGSTDKSSAICDRFEEYDERIRVIHKKNGGLSSARNMGIKEASGEYIVFVDSDDWIESYSLSEIEKIIHKFKPDVVVTTITEAYQSELRHINPNFKEYLEETAFSKNRAIDWIMDKSDSVWPAPQYICSRKFILDKDLMFKEGYLQEDVDWTARVLFNANTFGGYAQSWYNYRIKREGSISNSIKAKFITDIIEIAVVDEYYFKPDSDPIGKRIFDGVMKDVYYSINMYRNCTKNDKQLVCTSVKNNMRIFRHTPGIKFYIFSLFLKLIGVKNTLELISFI